MKNTITPVIAFTLAFAAGILLAAHLGMYSLALLPALPATLLLFFLQRGQLHLAKSIAFECSLLLAVVALGAAMALGTAQLPNHHIAHQIGKRIVVEGTVPDGSHTTARGQKAILHCNGGYSGKVLLYLPASMPALPHHSQISAEITPGDLGKMNPSYACYLQSQGIRAVANASSVTVTGRETGIAYQLGELRQSLSAKLQANMPDPRMAGLATAMFVGDRSALDTELRADFAATGLSHILSISGMHVSLLYFFLKFILGFLGTRLLGCHVRTGIIVAVLLLYMALAGFSPAVCRAVFMLIALRLSETFFQEKNSLNLLALSALVLLLVDPLMLHDLGFQLSYLAVLGLLVLGPRFEALLQARLGFLPKLLRTSIALTFAAQVLTTPLVLYHFGQFPAYFLLANLVLLPVVTFATYLGLAAMLFCWVPMLGGVLGTVLDVALWVVTAVSALIAELPGAVATRFSFRDAGFCVLMATLAGLVVAVAHVELRAGLRWLGMRFRLAVGA